MTEKELRKLAAETAMDYLGCGEADGSHKEIIDRYNAIRPLPAGYKMQYTDPWCAAFVSAVGAECGLTDLILPECSCDRMIALYQKAGRWQEDDGYSPQTGDILFYDWDDSGAGDNTGSADHVGIVYGNSGGQLTVVEGNISDRVDLRYLAVNARYIRGYGLPNYAGAAGTAAEAAGTSSPSQTGEKPKTAGDGYTLCLRILRSGCTGEDVKALQWLLKDNGYPCGSFGVNRDGADGAFGAQTRAKLIAYQRARGLDADGEAGPLTMGALLGIR